MARFKEYALTALALIVSLAALGLFASLGFVILAMLAIAGLAIAAVSWVASVAGPKPDVADA